MCLCRIFKRIWRSKSTQKIKWNHTWNFKGTVFIKDHGSPDESPGPSESSGLCPSSGENGEKLNVEYSKQMKELLSKPKKKKETKKDFLKDKVDKDLIDSDDEETNDTNDSENNIAEISDRLVIAQPNQGSTDRQIQDFPNSFSSGPVLSEIL